MPEARGAIAIGLRRQHHGLALARLGLLFVVVLGAFQVALPFLRLRGEVRDAQTGGPLPGAVARAEGYATRTGPEGDFQLDLLPPWSTITVEAEGYEPRTVGSWPPFETSVALTPVPVDIQVLHADTGQPLEASLESDFGRLQPVGPGHFRLAPVKTGTQVTARAEGFQPASTTFSGGAGVELRLAPIRIGRVVDSSNGRPIPGAVILADEQLFVSDAEGRFELPARPKRPLRVTAPGYRRTEVDTVAAGSLELHLEPFVARGLYLTVYGVADSGLRGNALRLLETTEANTLVIDVKGDRGFLTYTSRVPLAEQIGANAQPTLPDLDRLLADLRGRGYYTIARIVVMKDDLLAHNGGAAGLDVAVKDRRNGQVWVDGEGLGWVDPFRREVWEYNVALAREAAERGFDEIQFDYIRFPTDPSSSTSVDSAVYSQVPDERSRPEAIAGLLSMTREALRPLGAYLSIDTFGYACWRDDDMGIGHELAVLAPHVDYISPMVYPSTYSAGLPGMFNYPTVITRPYDVIFHSLEQAKGRIAGKGAILRPWLQYFDDYPWATGRAYNAAEIQAQKKATADAGAVGWMMWDPFNRYARGGLNPR